MIMKCKHLVLKKIEDIQSHPRTLGFCNLKNQGEKNFLKNMLLISRAYYELSGNEAYNSECQYYYYNQNDSDKCPKFENE